VVLARELRPGGRQSVGAFAELASLRPRPGSTVGYATRVSLRELGRRGQFLDGQLERPGELIAPLVTARAPGLLALYGIGTHTAALLLIAAGDHPERLRSEAAWAHLCAAAPIPASSGKTVRHRLNPGGDRQANHALYAPRGALSYSRCSREKLGGRFLGLMANLASKD